MVAYSFNAQQHTPQYGGGGGGLPAGPNGENVRYKVMIVGSAGVDSSKKDQFGNPTSKMLVFELACVEGPQQGVKHNDRLNLFHVNPETVRIANQQLSAYCHAIGVYQFQETAELHNKPFFVEIGLQDGAEARAKGYTEVKKLFDLNGNEPGKNANQSGGQPQNQGQPNMPNNPPAGGVTAQGGGWGNGGGQPQNQGGQNFGDPNQNNQNNGGQNFGGGQPMANQGGQPQNGGQGWGQPNQGQQPQNQGQPQNNQGGGNWGGNPNGGGSGGPQWGQQANGGNAGWGGPNG